ncbi:unnamed protein product, partial [Allacma fusca]
MADTDQMKLVAVHRLVDYVSPRRMPEERLNLADERRPRASSELIPDIRRNPQVIQNRKPNSQVSQRRTA